LPTNFDEIFGRGGLYGWQQTKQMLLVIWSHDVDPGLLIREFYHCRKEIVNGFYGISCSLGGGFWLCIYLYNRYQLCTDCC